MNSNMSIFLCALCKTNCFSFLVYNLLTNQYEREGCLLSFIYQFMKNVEVSLSFFDIAENMKPTSLIKLVIMVVFFSSYFLLLKRPICFKNGYCIIIWLATLLSIYVVRIVKRLLFFCGKVLKCLCEESLFHSLNDA